MGLSEKQTLGLREYLRYYRLLYFTLIDIFYICFVQKKINYDRYTHRAIPSLILFFLVEIQTGILHIN